MKKLSLAGLFMTRYAFPLADRQTLLAQKTQERALTVTAFILSGGELLRALRGPLSRHILYMGSTGSTQF